MRTALVSKCLLQKKFSLSWAATNLLVLLALLASPAASFTVRQSSIMHRHVVAATRAKASGLRAARMGFDDVYRAMIPGKGNPISDSSVLKWLALPEVFVLLSQKPAAGATIRKHLFSSLLSSWQDIVLFFSVDYCRGKREKRLTLFFYFQTLCKRRRDSTTLAGVIPRPHTVTGSCAVHAHDLESENPFMLCNVTQPIWYHIQFDVIH